MTGGTFVRRRVTGRVMANQPSNQPACCSPGAGWAALVRATVNYPSRVPGSFGSAAANGCREAQPRRHHPTPFALPRLLGAGWRLCALGDRRPATLVVDPLDSDPVRLGQVVHTSGQAVSVRRPRRGLGELTQGFPPARLDRRRVRWLIARHRAVLHAPPECKESIQCSAMMYSAHAQ